MPSVNPDNWSRRQEILLGTIANEQNRATVRRYLNNRQANGMKPGTLSNEGNALRGLCEFLRDRRLEDVTREDVTAYVLDARRIRIWRNADKAGKETITRREVLLGPATLAQRKVVIKCFFKWLRGGEDYPPEVRWLKTKRPDEDQLPVDNLVTTDDLARLLQACPDYRAKALIAVLYESGFRAGEVCALNVGSVTFGAHGCHLTLPKKAAGLKTGARRVLLFEATPYVQAW